MRRAHISLMIGLFCGVSLCIFGLLDDGWAATEPTAASGSTETGLDVSTLLDSESNAELEAFQKDYAVGHQVATSVSAALGVSASPLLGVSGFAAYRYFMTPEERRHLLPWYFAPGVWGGGLAITVLFALNTLIGSVIPPLKKPMDVVELFENKVSFLLASPVMVGQVATSVALVGAVASAAFPAPQIMTADVMGIASVDPALLSYLVSVGVCLPAMFVVWMAFHAFNVLILISPFGGVDFVLRLMKLAVLGVVAVSTLIHPYLGLLVCTVLVYVSYRVAGWSFRLTVFGSIFSWDLITLRHRRKQQLASPFFGFAGRALSAPGRTFGHLEQDSTGRWVFLYRPWLVMPLRKVVLGGVLEVQTGLLAPDLMTPVEKGGRGAHLIKFAPRYKSHEQELAGALGAELKEGILGRELASALGWLKEMFAGAGKAPSGLEGEVSR